MSSSSKPDEALGLHDRSPAEGAFVVTLEMLSTMRYAAHVTTHGSGRITLRVSDVPGAVTFGHTEAEAIARARRIVPLLIRQLMIDGLPVPAPFATGDVWIDLPADDVEIIERYAASRPNNRYALRSVIWALLAERKRELSGPAA